MTHGVYLWIISLVLPCVCSVYRPAVFLFGDSTTFGVYVHGILPLCGSGTYPDPRAQLFTEDAGIHHRETSMECEGNSVMTRVGAAFHWGVSPVGPYHSQWVNNQKVGYSMSSTENMATATREFVKRAGSESIVLVFASNLWDSARYREHMWDQLPPAKFLREYKTNLTLSVTSIRALLPSTHTFFLLTTVVSRYDFIYSFDSHLVNSAMREVAANQGIGLIDASAINDAGCPSAYLVDWIHQNTTTSLTIARMILDRSIQASS